MAVALDAQSTTSGGTTVTVASGATGATCSDLTIGTGGSNYALLASVIFDYESGAAEPQSLSAHWDSSGTNQSMAQCASQTSQGANATTGFGVYWFGLVAPTSGNKTFKLNWNAVGQEVHMYLFSFTGVNQTGGTTTFPNTAGASGTNGSSLSATLTSASGDGFVVGAVSDNTINSGSLTGTAGYIQNNGPQVASAANYGSGSASVSLSATFAAGGTNIFLCGVDIAAAAASLTLQGFQPLRIMRKMTGWRKPKNIWLPEPAWQMKKAA